MTYNVVVSADAEEDFENILKYLLFEKNNGQAAEHFINDFENTKNRLAIMAEKIRLCTNPRLKMQGYRRMNFIEMEYFFLFRISGENVVIDNIFHRLQDYESKMQ
ncbi:MAG: type II toxin-antitoxin system RelE/ParE family toxin [Lachnospiraceae bacterium]|nr:type II toxin-antitoxin system RelE/ParE family toxin [Lachnospiraceae bacterium]